MKVIIRLILAMSLGVALVSASRASTSDDVLSLYQQFYRAQNAHDLKTVAGLFLDSPDFLWISDGKPFWGRPATLERMSMFQENAVWRVEPALDKARVVELTPASAYVHLPLDLVIGSGPQPDRLAFLVTVLCVKTADGWRIAGLLTTTAKPE